MTTQQPDLPVDVDEADLLEQQTPVGAPVAPEGDLAPGAPSPVAAHTDSADVVDRLEQLTDVPSPDDEDDYPHQV